MAYDPVKAHKYYEEHKNLKGRKNGRAVQKGGHPSGAAKPAKLPSSHPAAAQARVARLKSKISTLQGALTKAMQALSEKRASETKSKKESSDNKSTAKEKQSSKEYRDKHKTEIASKRKKEGGGSSSTSSTSVSDMSVEQLESRIDHIKSALADAKRQLSNATQSVGHMAHSAILADPMINEHFARFRSAERNPSNDSSDSSS